MKDNRWKIWEKLARGSSAETASSGKVERSGGFEVQLNGVSKVFEGQRAVDDIDLTIPAGSFVTLLGPSGSGKSTTLNLIAGFLTPDEGSVLFDGRDVSNLPPQHRDIGMVFQSYALFPHMTVFDNVAYPLRMREKLDRRRLQERVQETLELVQLDRFQTRYPRQLSGGQQQRVAMARALVGRPRLLLMDEPLGALDKKLREQLQVEIKNIHRQVGSTFIYVTHDQSEALTMSDLVVVMSNARISQLGTPRQLYETPANTFVADFLGGANLLPGAVLAAREGQSDVRLDDGSTITVPVDGPWSEGERAHLFIRPEDVSVASGSAAERLLTGRVVSVVYLGEALRVTVDVGCGSVVARCPRDGEHCGVSVGDTVGLVWSPRHMRLLRPEAGR